MKVRLKDQNDEFLVVQEGESWNLVVTFADLSATPVTITKANFASLTVTLFHGSTVINSRLNQSVIDANDGTMTTAGVLTLRMSELDAVLVDDTITVGDEEEHTIRLKWGWNDGVDDRTGVVEYTYGVEKIADPTVA